MAAHLFTALFYLLFLLMCGTFLCTQMCAADNAPSSDSGRTIQLFQEKENGNVKSAQEQLATKEITVNDYYSPLLVKSGNVVVALAGVNRKSKDNKIIIVLTKQFAIENEEDWKNKVFTSSGSSTEWKTLFAAYDDCDKNACDGSAVVRGLVAAANKNEIYIFLVNTSTQAQEASNELKWKFWLVKNKPVQGTGSNNLIAWNKEETLAFTGVEKLKDILKNEKRSDISLFDGSAFVIEKEEKKIVFVVKCQYKEGDTGVSGVNKNLTAVFQYDEKSSSNKFELLHVESTEGLHPSFFQWKGKIFKTPTDEKSESSKNIMEFNVDSKRFEVTQNSIVSFQNFFKDKKYFLNATIQGKEVLLFTQQNYGATQNEVYLWMTDGTCVSKVGTIIPTIGGLFYGSFLQTNDELIVLHQNYQQSSQQDSNKKIYLTRLKEELEKIKHILGAWKQNDDNIQEGCKETNKENIFCTPPLPTNGLVGFLNSIVVEGEITTWKDEYYYTNATVKNGTKSGNWLKFAAAGAGARWPIGKPKEDQPYSFNTPGFTLVATVKIDNDKSKNSILGIRLEEGDGKNSIGLWCDNGKWAVSYGNSQAETSSITKTCVKYGIYQAALMLNDKDNTFSVHIGAEQLHKIKDETKQLGDIKHFYFGADTAEQQESPSADESHVTIKNVLLYKRPLLTNEIEKLKEYVRPVEVVTPVDGSVDTNTSGNSDPQTPPTLPTSPTGDEKKEEKAPSPSRTEDGGVGGGVRAFSLLLALLCVSAQLLHL